MGGLIFGGIFVLAIRGLIFGGGLYSGFYGIIYHINKKSVMVSAVSSSVKAVVEIFAISS